VCVVDLKIHLVAKKAVKRTVFAKGVSPGSWGLGFVLILFFSFSSCLFLFWVPFLDSQI